MDGVFSKFHVTKVSSSAAKGRYANFKRWVGRKQRAFFNPSVRTTDVEPFNGFESVCPSPTSSCSTNLSEYTEEHKHQGRHTDNARCAINRSHHGKFPLNELDNFDNETTIFSRPNSTETHLGDVTCATISVNPRRLPRSTCRYRYDNIQLLRDIMTLEGNAISEDAAEDLLDSLKSKIEENKAGMKMEQRQREEEMEEEDGEEMELDGILKIEAIQKPIHALTLSGKKSRYQEMKEVCCQILQEDDEDEKPEYEAETDDKEEIIEIDETDETCEEVIEQGHELKYANSTEELEATINDIFKRWNLSMPNDQGEFAKINETVRSSLSRAASICPKTAHQVNHQPALTETETVTRTPSLEKLQKAFHVPSFSNHHGMVFVL